MRGVAPALGSVLALLCLRAGESSAQVKGTAQPLDSVTAVRLDGAYKHGRRVLELTERARRLFLEPDTGRARLAVHARGDTLVAADSLGGSWRFLTVGDALVVGADTFRRSRAAPPNPPAEWRPLLGEYGEGSNALLVLERHGRLATLQHGKRYSLAPAGRGRLQYMLGPRAGDVLRFLRDRRGRVTAVVLGGDTLARKASGDEDGGGFRIRPQRPVEELRAEAIAATPPQESGEFRTPELVELRALDPTIRYDIRYATTNNFMGAVFYSQPRAFLQREAAQAVVRAHRRLAAKGYGLLIHDAYRPWYVTKMFWDATPAEQREFVADPSRGSRHNRGAAVDLTLYDRRTGKPVEMVSGYDEFSGRAHPDYAGGTSRQRWLRELLRDAMEAEGFNVYEVEWWHFDYADWRRYPILNVRFEALH